MFVLALPLSTTPPRNFIVRLAATVIHALASTTREHGLTPALCHLHMLLEMGKDSWISIAMLISSAARTHLRMSNVSQ